MLRAVWFWVLSATHVFLAHCPPRVRVDLDFQTGNLCSESWCRVLPLKPQGGTVSHQWGSVLAICSSLSLQTGVTKGGFLTVCVRRYLVSLGRPLLDGITQL